jgi:AcrR family transcriptional regulator
VHDPKLTSADPERLRAELVAYAQRIVERDGPGALTMRALAAEAGCAVGLPYKVFASRKELVAELIHADFRRLRDGFERVIGGAGTGTVAGHLAEYAELLLGSPSVALMAEIGRDAEVFDAIVAYAAEIGLPPSLAHTVEAYLAAEKPLGRVDPAVDERAFGFVISGAIHNLLVSGEAYPRPASPALRAHRAAIAARLAPGSGIDSAPATEGS